MKSIALGLLVACALRADVVIDWNAVALSAIRSNNTAPPVAARNLAILHVAIYDAVNGIRQTHKPYLVTSTGPASASVVAAAHAAARRVLLNVFPAQLDVIEQQYQAALKGLADNAARAQGLAFGDSVAVTILQARAGDGSASSVVYTPGTLPGQWRPTVSFGGVVRPALLSHWGSVRPFVLVSGLQFRPPPPPSLTSAQYTAEFNQVKQMGSTGSAARSAEQTEIARFWGYGPGTATPPGHWNQIAQALVKDSHGRGRDHDWRGGSELAGNARLFALLNVAMADAAIVSWDSKYTFNLWRPISAIQEAATDGNSATEADGSWTPLLATPPFPEYTSGHSTFSGAAAVVLAHYFGSDRVRFTVGSDDLPGVRRTYRSFSEAALESGISRIYGGIHFSSANVHGLSTGAAVGIFVAWNALLELDSER